MSSIKKSKNFLSSSLHKADQSSPSTNTIFNNSEDTNDKELKTLDSLGFLCEEMIVHNQPKSLVNFENLNKHHLANLAKHGIRAPTSTINPYARVVDTDSESEQQKSTSGALRASRVKKRKAPWEFRQSKISDDDSQNDISDVDLDNDNDTLDQLNTTTNKTTASCNGTTNSSSATIIPADGTKVIDTFRVDGSDHKFQCHLCESEVTWHSKYGFNAHLKNKHAEYWKNNKHHFVEVKISFVEEAAKMEEVILDPDSNRYTCKPCGKQFDKARAIYHHVCRIHRKRIEAVCEYCQKEFTNYANYWQHVMTHTGTYPYKCEYCGKGVRKIQKLREHKKANHRELYEIELKEEREKKENEEKEVERKLKSGELVLQQRVSLNEMEVSDIINRIIGDSHSRSDDLGQSVFALGRA